MIIRVYFILITTIGFISLSCSYDPVSLNKKENTPPSASFAFVPDSGDTSTVFEVDASNSSDKEDSTSYLEVRWDWENDGIWDTEYSKQKTANHKYATTGSKTIALEVRDSGGKLDSAINKISVSDVNTPITDSLEVILLAQIPNTGKVVKIETDFIFMSKNNKLIISDISSSSIPAPLNSVCL